MRPATSPSLCEPRERFWRMFGKDCDLHQQSGEHKPDSTESITKTISKCPVWWNYATRRSGEKKKHKTVNICFFPSLQMFNELNYRWWQTELRNPNKVPRIEVNTIIFNETFIVKHLTVISFGRFIYLNKSQKTQLHIKNLNIKVKWKCWYFNNNIGNNS